MNNGERVLSELLSADGGSAREMRLALEQYLEECFPVFMASVDAGIVIAAPKTANIAPRVGHVVSGIGYAAIGLVRDMESFVQPVEAEAIWNSFVNFDRGDVHAIDLARYAARIANNRIAQVFGKPYMVALACAGLGRDRIGIPGNNASGDVFALADGLGGPYPKRDWVILPMTAHTPRLAGWHDVFVYDPSQTMTEVLAQFFRLAELWCASSVHTPHTINPSALVWEILILSRDAFVRSAWKDVPSLYYIEGYPWKLPNLGGAQ